MPLIKGFKSILQAKSSSFLIKQENSGENKVYDLCQLSEEQEQSDDLTSKCQLAVKERILFDMKSNLNSGHSTGDLQLVEKMHLLELLPGNRAIREQIVNGVKITEIIEAEVPATPEKSLKAHILESTQTQFKPVRSHEILYTQTLSESAGLAIWHMQE